MWWITYIACIGTNSRFKLKNLKFSVEPQHPTSTSYTEDYQRLRLSRLPSVHCLPCRPKKNSALWSKQITERLQIPGRTGLIVSWPWKSSLASLNPSAITLSAWHTKTKWPFTYRIHSCLFSLNCWCRQSDTAVTLQTSLTSLLTGNV